MKAKLGFKVRTVDGRYVEVSEDEWNRISGAMRGRGRVLGDGQLVRFMVTDSAGSRHEMAQRVPAWIEDAERPDDDYRRSLSSTNRDYPTSAHGDRPDGVQRGGGAGPVDPEDEIDEIERARMSYEKWLTGAHRNTGPWVSGRARDAAPLIERREYERTRTASSQVAADLSHDSHGAVDENYVTDAFGNPAGHQPGYVVSTDSAALQRLDAAYAERDAWLQNAWRNPGPGASGEQAWDNDEDDEDPYEAHKRRLSNAWRTR